MLLWSLQPLPGVYQNLCHLSQNPYFSPGIHVVTLLLLTFILDIPSRDTCTQPSPYYIQMFKKLLAQTE